MLDSIISVNLLGLGLRAFFNLLICISIVRFIYSRQSNNREFIFALYTFNIVIFSLCALLRDVEMQIGSGFGLFALFGLLNYRTEVMKTKDMTYLLVVISVGFINGLYKDGSDLGEVIFLNILIIVAVYLLESILLANFPMSTRVRYEKIELITPDKRNDLVEDLKLRTGLNITDITIDDINYLNDTALITIYHKNKK
ncbi:MAG: DUF4956 domain-containing protein [Bacteroidia bacterium]|nr:DUF4956 domain-containing protein [Bacteroidia bacterium]